MSDVRRQVTYVVGIIAVSVAGLVYTFASGNEPLLGLDLHEQGRPPCCAWRAPSLARQRVAAWCARAVSALFSLARKGVGARTAAHAPPPVPLADGDAEREAHAREAGGNECGRGCEQHSP